MYLWGLYHIPAGDYHAYTSSPIPIFPNPGFVGTQPARLGELHALRSSHRGQQFVDDSFPPQHVGWELKMGFVIREPNMASGKSRNEMEVAIGCNFFLVAIHR